MGRREVVNAARLATPQKTNSSASYHHEVTTVHSLMSTRLRTLSPAVACMNAKMTAERCLTQRPRTSTTTAQEQNQCVQLLMDPLSITAATIGISTAACASIATLRNTISGLGEAQEELHSIRFQLDNIEKPLRILDSFAVDETALVSAQRILAKTTISHTVNNCGKACEAFDKKLKRWTRHSQDVKLSLRDKMSVGVWNVEKIRTFKVRVETCGQIVQLAVSSTQL